MMSIKKREKSIEREPVALNSQHLRGNRATKNPPLSNAGFTLLELIIVIAILSILSVAVVLVMNPVGTLERARDSTRLSDINSIATTLDLLRADVSSLSLGVVNTIYVSVPDTSSTCANLGLPALPVGLNYACVTTANLRNVDGTGWVPVDFDVAGSMGSPISAVPVDPLNGISSNLYYTYTTDGTAYIIRAQRLESVEQRAKHPNGFPLGVGEEPHVYPTHWVAVPGNGTFGTSDFYVMKYEAKCIQTSNNTPLIAPLTGVDSYDNSAQTCTGASRYVASTPGGYPIGSISHATAVSYCDALDAHLMTNAEWMTIARNAEQVDENWTNGSVGDGALKRGNSSSGNTAMEGFDSLSGTNTRTMTLSNSSVIWDLAGNVWNHVKKDDADTLVDNLPTDGGADGWRFIQHTAITGYGDLSYDEIRPSNASWNTIQGMGKVYTYNGAFASRVLVRGGRWGGSTAAGAFALMLFWDVDDTSGSLGFRCVL